MNEGRTSCPPLQKVGNFIPAQAGVLWPSVFKIIREELEGLDISEHQLPAYGSADD